MVINVSIIENYISGSSLSICTWFYYDTFKSVRNAPDQRISYLSTVGSLYSLFTHGLDRPYSNLEKLIVSIVKSVVFVAGTFVFVNAHP